VTARRSLPLLAVLLAALPAARAQDAPPGPAKPAPPAPAAKEKSLGGDLEAARALMKEEKWGDLKGGYLGIRAANPENILVNGAVEALTFRSLLGAWQEKH
jgi:hypothetical protein